ncbi:MAG: hypothetical protein ACODAC_11840 [Pseudomonadota bacterium]
MARPLTRNRIRRDNLAFSGTGGVSTTHRHSGFTPAFRDDATGEVAISRYADGRPAPMHLMDGLPPDWVASRDARGHACALKPSIVAGFVREGEFFTREQAAAVMP